MANRLNKLKTGATPKGTKAKEIIKKSTTAERANVETGKRVKYTTAIRSDIVQRLKITAIEKGIRPADIIEKALLEYLNIK